MAPAQAAFQQRGSASRSETLDKALSDTRDPHLTTLLGGARALGVTLTAHVEQIT